MDLPTARSEFKEVKATASVHETSPDAAPVVALTFSADVAPGIATYALVELKACPAADGRVVAGTRVMPADATGVPLTMDAANRVLEPSADGSATITADAS